MDEIQRKLVLIGIVTEICGNKVVRVFEDMRLKGGFMVSTRDPQGLTDGEIQEIDWQIGGLDLEVSHQAESHPVATIWLKPSQRHLGGKSHQRQTRSLDRGTGEGAADLRRAEGKQRRNKKRRR